MKLATMIHTHGHGMVLYLCAIIAIIITFVRWVVYRRVMRLNSRTRSDGTFRSVPSSLLSAILIVITCSRVSTAQRLGSVGPSRSQPPTVMPESTAWRIVKENHWTTDSLAVQISSCRQSLIARKVTPVVSNRTDSLPMSPGLAELFLLNRQIVACRAQLSKLPRSETIIPIRKDAYGERNG